MCCLVLCFWAFSSFSQTPKDTLYIENYRLSGDTLREHSIPLKEKKSSANQLESPFFYQSSDSTEMLLGDQKTRLYRNAQIKYDGIELKADNIFLDMNSKIIVAYGRTDSTGKVIGKPEFIDGKSPAIQSDTILYNLETKKGLIKGVFTKQGEGYLHSEVNKKLPNNDVCLKNGKYTTCDHEHPHFYLALTKAKVIPNDKIVSGPAYIVIEDIALPIGIPFGFFPNRSGGASGIIIPGYGEENGRGFFLREGGYYFHINDYVDTKILGDIYTNGSWGVANETRYKWRYRFNGNLYAKYMRFITNDDEPNRSVQNTYRIEWRHNQDAKANPYSRFSANVDFSSSDFKLYNHMQANNRLSTTQNSSISYNRRFANTPFNLSVNARQSQNTSIQNNKNTGLMDITLPSVNLSMNRLYPLKGLKKSGKEAWYEKIGISYSGSFSNQLSGLNEDTLWSAYTLTQFKNGVQHRIPISTNFKLFKYINISPSFNYTERWYFKALERSFNLDSNRVEIDTLNGFRRVYDFTTSLSLTSKVYGMYQAKNPNGFFKALRHIVTPTISFSWRPDFSEPHWGYYQHIYKGDSLVGIYSRYQGAQGSWSGIYGSPPKGRSGRINFNLNNNFEMKVRNRKDTISGSKKVKLLDRLSFRTSYNLAVDSLNWSNLSITAGTQIAEILNMDFSVNIDPYDFNRKTGRRVNDLMWSKGKLGYLKSARLSSGIRFSSEGIGGKSRTANLSENEKENLRNIGYTDYMLEMGYADFSIPWSLNIDYSINFSQAYNVKEQKFKDNTSQTMNVNGTLNLAKNWKGRFRSGWDFEKKEMAYTSITLVRDLHCWEFSFNWVPFGTYRSYYFKINVKSAMLQDLKYEQRRSWLEDL